MNLRPPRRTAKDYLLPFLIIIAGGVVIMLLFKIVPQILSDEEISLGKSGTAELSVAAGEVEAYLPAAEAWKIISATEVLHTGESVRTSADGKATLKFDDGSVVTLAGSSRVKIAELYNSLTTKKIALEFEQGSLAAEVSTEAKSDLTISTELLKIYKADGKFLLTSDSKETNASAVAGGFAAKILDPQEEKSLPNYVVEQGQTLTISERRVNLLRIGGEIELVKPTADEIQKSELYIALAGKTETAETTETEESSEATADAETPTETAAETPETASTSVAALSAPVVTTGSGNIKADKDPVSVSGTASPGAAKIEVTPEGGSPYVLIQFVSGSGKWKYNAAEEYGNLKKGRNTYEVVAIDSAGNRSPAATFIIDYQPTKSETVENSEDANTEASASEEDTTSGVPEVGSATFAPPTVITPQDGQTFTSDPIHFEGTVPAGTKEVLVNEYKLTNFESGSTTWYYNAKTEYGNLESGENEYEIVAVSESGERSSVTIKVIYQPN